MGKWPKNQEICSRLFEDCETKINYVPSEVTIVDNSRIYSVTSFLFLKIESWNFQHLIHLEFCESSQNFRSFGQLLFFRAHVINWIQIQLVTWGVTNRDVLLLTAICYSRNKEKSLSNNLFVIELPSSSSILDEPILKPSVATTPITTSVITTTVTPTTEKSKMLFQKLHAHCQIPCPSILFQTILDLAGTIWMGPNCFGLIKTFWTWLIQFWWVQKKIELGQNNRRSMEGQNKILSVPHTQKIF